MKVTLQPAYVLHQRPYRETSALIESFTEDYGRVSLIAKGIKRKNSKVIGLLQPFQPLLISWVGRSNLVTLTGVEASGSSIHLVGEPLICGFYLNELLLRLLSYQDSFKPLFSIYARSLQQLACSEQYQPILRLFERDLLIHLGYAPLLKYEIGTHQPIKAEQWYSYQIEKGPSKFELNNGIEGMKLKGQTLLSLAYGKLTDSQSVWEAKNLLRWLLSPYLGDKPLKSRAMLVALRQLTHE
ncbi:DNA repair protein RecO [Candidatus Nitrosacidococcus sp. I8]|uniref:DNA repair protein RecO n=1 Tax=Candidatus Nitrosacidococcus sp. I8 TaxID=2942908 RepID=UPI002226E6C5|nr:DNA repair protein RecO [Candidatus Nitrosacidococcus sp. I8]CAH9017426.1 DNA repair protein RecO [Candidatus Nitrosacidococcus sp. I8]